MCSPCFPTMDSEDFHTSAFILLNGTRLFQQMKQKYKRNKCGSRDDKFRLGYADFEMPKEHPRIYESEVLWGSLE